MTDMWPAPYSASPINHTQVVPGSKSMTNRAYVLAALAMGRSTIVGALRSRDTDLMRSALNSMGVEFSEADDHVYVTPGELTGATIDCGLAGTVMRFVSAVASFAQGDVLFDGDPAARKRPMNTILDALRSLGVAVSGETLPFTVHGHGSAEGGSVTVDASGSSQFVSGLLLAAPRFDRGVSITHSGGSLPSLPHIEMTVNMLEQSGVRVSTSGHAWEVAPQPIQARTWVIEPDLSNATPFLAAAAVTGGVVSVPNWPTQTAQAGDKIRDILQRMGCEVTLETAEDTEGTEASHTVHVRGPARGSLTGIDLNMSDIGELTPTVAALATAATTASELTGIAHLRGHETDRLKALTDEINALGGHCEELPDGLRIHPARLHGGQWHSYHDHRMATAGAIIGLTTEGVEVENITTTAKTLPGFEIMWAQMVEA